MTRIRQQAVCNFITTDGRAIREDTMKEIKIKGVVNNVVEVAMMPSTEKRRLGLYAGKKKEKHFYRK
ncbi:MAG: hypothetical protein RR335_11925 [Eubacterium sp.]